MQTPTLFEAAHMIGLPPVRARAALAAAGLYGPRGGRRNATIEQVEALALELYPWKTHVHNPHSYWVSIGQAAEILEVSIPRVKQLVDRERLPFVRHRSGTRLFRREQLEVVANSRLARKLQS